MGIFEQLLDLHHGTIAGYKPLGKIAEGGMSTVYKAISLRTQKIVAIKILFPRYGKRKVKLQKLFSEKQVEGEITTSLNHPNVIQTYSEGRRWKQHYFVMEYVNGKNLKDLIYKNPELIRGRKYNIIRQVVQGLRYIHSRGIIHRDVCPKNILVSEDGEVKIIDFGLSISKTSRYKNLVERSGTPSYMAPEQIRALGSDERSDIYSFGVTVYELIAEKPPFAGEDSFARMQQHLSYEPVSLGERMADVPPALEEIVYRAMQKRPEERYKSMDALLDSLEKVESKESSL